MNPSWLGADRERESVHERVLVLVATILTCGVLASTAYAQVCGDVDGSGAVTVTDGVNVLRAAAGLSGGCPISACDVDGNGSVTVTDGVNVLRVAAGLQTALSCDAADLIFDKVREEGPFGELTKKRGGLTEPANASRTVQDIAFADSFVLGKTNTITVGYDVGGALAQATDADLSLLVASALEDGTPSPGFFELPIESDKGTVTLALDLRKDVAVQTFRLKIANGSGGLAIGKIETVFIVILREAPPRCGNSVLDSGESCDPPGTTCALGSDPGFCTDACLCTVVPGPRPTSVIPPSMCQNGIRESGEQCDQQDASACGGQTCRSDCTCNPAPTPLPTSTPASTPLLTSTPHPATTSTPIPGNRFVDNGDGTVTDFQMELQWEQKTGTVGSNVDCSATACPDPHAVNNRYQWCLNANHDNACDNPNIPNGGAFTDFLNKLNNRCRDNQMVDCTANGDADCSAGPGGPCGFAGHRDWRLPKSAGRLGMPSGEPAELESILRSPCGGTCIDPIFGPTVNNIYWSATDANATDSTKAWFVSFGDGSVLNNSKYNPHYVRAVRGLGP